MIRPWSGGLWKLDSVCTSIVLLKDITPGGYSHGKSQQRQGLADAARAILEPHLPGQNEQLRGDAKNNRLLIDAVFGMLRTGHHCVTGPGYGKQGNSMPAIHSPA